MSILGNISRRIRQLNLLLYPPFNERRRHKRYPIDFGVQVSVGGRVIEQRAVDLSSSGMLLSPGFNADLRESVRISVSGLLADVPARVVGLRPNGVALQFDSETHGELFNRWLLDTTGSHPLQ